MSEQEILAQRIIQLCQEKNISYYILAYRAAVPMTTLMHILDGSTKNPGIFTLSKICSGLNISLREFFSTKEFDVIGYEVE